MLSIDDKMCAADFRQMGVLNPVRCHCGRDAVVCVGVEAQSGNPVVVRHLSASYGHSQSYLVTQILLYFHLKHENAVSTIAVYIRVVDDRLYDVFLVQEAMDYNLHDVRSKGMLSPDVCVLITYQILRFVKYMHSTGVSHGDLKLTNILCNKVGLVRVCDFGSAHITTSHRPSDGLSSTTSPHQESNTSSCQEDLRSIGRIFLELVGVEPVCENAVWSLGVSPSSEVELRYLSKIGESLGAKRADLVRCLLLAGVDRQLTADQALAHPTFDGLRDSSDEPVMACPLFGIEYSPDLFLSGVRGSQLVAFLGKLGVYATSLPPPTWRQSLTYPAAAAFDRVPLACSHSLIVAASAPSGEVVENADNGERQRKGSSAGAVVRRDQPSATAASIIPASIVFQQRLHHNAVLMDQAKYWF